MASRRAIIIIEQDFGHPDNRPTKEFVFKVISEELPKAIRTIKDTGVVGLGSWDVVSITVE